MAKDLQFAESKGDVILNLEAIELNLVQYSDEKMLNFQNTYYNEIVDLVNEARDASTWQELMTVVAKAKILEVDIANWLARHGRASISLPWPKPPKELS